MTDTNARLDEIVRSADVVLFMKGSALFPQCGFSSRAVAILDHLGVGFEPWTCSRTRRSARASRPIRTGRPFPSFM
jgi:glutaredoxin-related protein